MSWSQNAQASAGNDMGSKPVGSPVQPCEKAALEPMLEVEEAPTFGLQLEVEAAPEESEESGS